MSHATLEQSGLLSQQKNQSSTWNQPIPLTHVLNNETPYPFDALPSAVQQIVNSYQCYGQQPLRKLMESQRPRDRTLCRLLFLDLLVRT